MSTCFASTTAGRCIMTEIRRPVPALVGQAVRYPKRELKAKFSDPSRDESSRSMSS